MVSLIESLKYPMTDWKKLFYGLLNIIPIIGGIIFTGYTIRVYEAGIKKKKEMPEFGGWWNNAKAGFVVMVYAFLLVLTSIIVLIAAFMGKTGIIGALIAIAYIMILTLLLPVLSANYASKGKWTAIFDFKNAFSKIGNNFPEYVINLCKTAIVFILSVIVIIIILPVTVALSVVTLGLAGLAINFFISAYAYYSIAYMWGSYYSKKK